MPTYVEGTNGRYYRAPFIYTDNWYVAFIDDDPPSIIVRSTGQSTAESEAKRMCKYLRQAGFKFKNFVYEASGLKAFPPEWKTRPAAWGRFEIAAPFPVDGVEIHSDADFEMAPDANDGQVLIWHRDFLVTDLETLWNNREVPETVLTYLGGTKQKCRNTIKKQFPEFPKDCDLLVRLRVRD